eukprot:TRINITY_DN2441_c0_g6_i1.p1 TRINITY_DN2441_c0_g6~~TRINITY_DN2441_c0_g6_i1.p1  ORF type:complete len:445 (+),score=138.50 TRINITY_DN2441_c0_g6_i1:296-1630(+)
MKSSSKKGGYKRSGSSANASSSSSSSSSSSNGHSNGNAEPVVSSTSSASVVVASNGNSKKGGSNISDGPEVITSFQDKLKENLELLSEKRYTTREGAIAELNNLLASKYCLEFVEANRDTLVDAAIRGLMRGSPKEQQLSARLLSLVAVTLGESQDHLYATIAPTLREIIKSGTEATVQAEAVNTIGAVCFVSTTDPSHPHELILFLQEFFDQDVKFQKNVLNAWSMMMLMVSEEEVQHTYFPDNAEKIASLLKNSSLDVKQAAGEAIALLLEIIRDAEEEAGEEFDINNYDYFDVNETLELLEDLSRENNRFVSKKELSAQRNTFKDIYAAVQNGTVPSTTLVFQHQKVSFTSWADVKKLELFRDILGTGLQHHFVNNELLHEVFGVSINPEQAKVSLSALEKRSLMSPSSAASKARSRLEGKTRGVRSVALQFGSDGGSDEE